MSEINFTIGICAKNEHALIGRTLSSVLEAASKTELFWEIFLCINGSTDNTGLVVENWVKKNPYANCQIIYQREANLVEAQRKIIEHKKIKDTPTIFVDADVIVNVDCFVYLLDAIRQPNIAVAYAISKPIHDTESKTTLIERVLNLYDSDRTIFSPRRHLHGRTFIIKIWNIPSTDPALLVDDIYLSFDIQNREGANAIKCIPQAIVYAQQIQSWQDYYHVFRRRTIEINKCFNLFPNFKKLPAEYVNRYVQVESLTKVSLRDLFLWLIFFFMRLNAKVRLNIELFLNPVVREQWEQALTTKKYRSEPLLILIEGLDCSGKKTTGRNLLELLNEQGISAQLHIGPLSYRWYAALSRFISLHTCPNILRSVIYSFEGIGDRNGILKINTDVILQISSPIRSWAYSQTSENTLRNVISSFVVKHFLAHYDQVWYLTSPYEIRRNRHKNQVAAGENPDTINRRFRNYIFFEKYERLLIEKLEITTGVTGSFDTAEKSPKEITSIILNAILKDI